MSLRPPLCSFKWVWEDDFGGALKLSVRELVHGEVNDNIEKVLLLVKYSIKHRWGYQVMHHLCQWQTCHQDVDVLHSSSYLR